MKTIYLTYEQAVELNTLLSYVEQVLGFDKACELLMLVYNFQRRKSIITKNGRILKRLSRGKS